MVGDKGRFTTHEQSKSILTPSVKLAPGLILSFHPTALIDISSVANSHKSIETPPSGRFRRVQ